MVRFLLLVMLVPGVLWAECDENYYNSLLEQSWQNHNHGRKDSKELLAAFRACNDERRSEHAQWLLEQFRQDEMLKELKRLNRNLEERRLH